MENEAYKIEDWIRQLAKEIKRDRQNTNSRVHSARTHPALQRIAAALDVSAHAQVGEFVDTGDAHSDALHANGSAAFRYTVPRFAHTVYLPVRKLDAALIVRPELRAQTESVRRCFLSILEHCKRKKRKRQTLIKGLLFWRRKTLLGSMGQWREFIAQSRFRVLKSCFSNWRGYCTRKRRDNLLVHLATTRRSKALLSKALNAWKRFVPTMRRERSHQFFVENRHDLLSKAHWFERWLTSFQQSHTLKMMRRRDEIRLLGMCLREWKVVASCSKTKRMQISQVNSYYSYTLLTKSWRDWVRFSETSSQKKRIARQAIENWLVKFCFQKWQIVTSNKRKLDSLRNSLSTRIVAMRTRFYIQKWRTALYVTRAKTRAAIIFFLHKKFVRWKTWTRKRKLSRLAAYYFGLRFFRRWYNFAYEKQRTQQLEKMALGFYAHRTVPLKMRRSINIWKKYTAYRKYKKKLYYDAALYFVGYLMPKRVERCISAWKYYTNKRQLSRAQDLVKSLKWNKIKLKLVFNLLLRKFSMRKHAKEKDRIVQNRLHEYLKRKYTLLVRACFQKWRAHVLSVAFFKASLATSHFTHTMLEKCFLAWATFTKRRIMTRIAAVVYRTKKLRSGFEIWQRMLDEQRIKWRIAELYNKQHLLTATFSRLRMYTNLSKQAVELRMYPLVKKREHNIQAKTFNAWLTFARHSTTKRELEVQALKFYIFHQLSQSFSKWKQFCGKSRGREKEHKATRQATNGQRNGKILPSTSRAISRFSNV
eukprot:Phypoly_transcript_03229.p1 GENE.Phypoly_transcript_03229~~Phypoly_transcript_03229.p1  ORF type:complete len:760 (+),score=43.12 Phypoly_transcript_03229:220-2499(+)